MVNHKDRKHSGRETPRLVVSKKEAIENNLEPQSFWNDWNDWRDGMRDLSDRSRIRNIYNWFARYYNVEKDNAKNKKLLARRKARKQGRIAQR